MNKEWNITRISQWLFFLYGVALVVFLNYWGVIETSEARYAEISREMFLTRDWIHPRLLEIYHFHKPPIAYWLTTVGYFLFGINSFGARFFLQISILLQLIIIFKIVKILFKHERMAITTCVIYATMYLVLITTRSLTTDSYLTLFVLLAIFSWIKWRMTGTTSWIYAISFSFAAGFLTKGPLIFIVPVSVFLGLDTLLPKQKINYHYVTTFILFVLIGFSWYGYLIYENKNFLSYFLYHQTYERAINAEVFSRKEPFWYYLVYLPFLLLPWSGLYLVSLFKEQSIIIRRMNIFWIGIPFIFFSAASSKLVLYVVPLCPAIAIVTAYYLTQAPDNKKSHWFVFGWFVFQWLALVLIKRIDASIQVTMPMLIIAAIALVSLLVLQSIKKIRSLDRIIPYALVSTIALVTYASAFMHENELKVNSTKPIVQWLKSNKLDFRNIVVYNKLLPSMAFHSGKPVISINAGDRYLKREVNFQENENWKNSLYDPHDSHQKEKLIRLVKTPSVLVVKGKIHPEDKWLESYFHHKHVEGKWVIYY